MKIGIIVGSTRENRVGLSVGEWVAAQAANRTEATYELVDLKEFNVPLLDTATPPAMLNGQYEDTRVQAWADKIGEFDAYIFVTAEYNHGVPGVFKNAVDQLGVEWMKKAVAFVSYGFGGGIMATENWRTVLANFGMYDIRDAVNLSLITDVKDGAFAPAEHHLNTLNGLFNTLEPAAKAMATLR